MLMKAMQARKGKLLLLWNATKVSIYFVWRFQSSFRRGEAQEQYDQIGIVPFFKVFGHTFFHFSYPNIFCPFGLLWKTSLLSKNGFGFFLGYFWLLFIWTSGCTAQESKMIWAGMSYCAFKQQLKTSINAHNLICKL